MKILYVTTISNTVNAFLIPHIKALIEEGHIVDVAFSIEQEVQPDVTEMGCKIHNVPFQRSPFRMNNLIAFIKLRDIIISESYDIVHTHTPVASAIVRLVCKGLTNVKVIYTAHGFHFHKRAPLIYWLLYYPVEKWLARYTDVLITINREDYERAKKKFRAKRVEYIPGVGIDLEKYASVEIDREQKRINLGVPKDAFIVLSVGELNKNKNHEVVIKAISRIRNSKIHYVVCGEGKLDGQLKSLSKALGMSNRVHFLGFRRDIPEICKISDVFAFPSLREGLGLAALEAMASGLPIITSDVHGIVDYSIDGETGYNCSPQDIVGFSRHIGALCNDTNRRKQMAAHNIEAVKVFESREILKKILSVYKNMTISSTVFSI